MKFRRLLSTAVLLLAAPFCMHAQSAPAKSAAPAAKPAAVTAASTPSAGLLDINTATPDQLKQLPGIGDAYSKRIVDGRPYAAKTQLVSRGILPKATYDGIAGQIIAKHIKK